MAQRFALASRHCRTYLVSCFVVAVAACRGGVKSIAPDALPPVDRSVVQDWVAEYAAKDHQRYVLQWTYRTAQGAAKLVSAGSFYEHAAKRYLRMAENDQ